MPSIENSNILIKSEEDAFYVIEQMLKRGFEDKRPYILQFDGWPFIQIRLRGEGFDSTITADIAESIVVLQSAINRTYARIVCGFPTGRIRKKDRQMLRFKAKVEEGSSLITIHLGNFFEKIASALLEKITGAQLVILVLGLAVIFCGRDVWKQYLLSHIEEKRIETEIKMSMDETKRLQIIKEIITRQPNIIYVVEDSDYVRNKIVRSIGDADSISVNGLELKQDAAKAIKLQRHFSAKKW